MIKLEKTSVMNFENAIRGMRNPLNSWELSDSMLCKGRDGFEDCTINPAGVCPRHEDFSHDIFCIGKDDFKLAMKLCKAGSDHRKFMRQIFVSVDITAPMYWWAEADTYKVGTVRNSCSKMHKLLAKPFEVSDFSFDKLPGYKNEIKQFRASNLEWVTQKENIAHSIENHLQPVKVKNYTGKFNAQERETIKRLWNSGAMSKREIAEEYNVSHTCVNDIINDKYKYAEKVNVFEEIAKNLVDTLNELRDSYLRTNDESAKRSIWYAIMQLLPQSYNQLSTLTLNYETLTNMYHARKNHKLDEWHTFCEWIESLPYSELITGGKDER